MTKFELDDFMNLLDQLRKETNDFKDLSTKDSKILSLETTLRTLIGDRDVLGRRLVNACDAITDVSNALSIPAPNLEMSDSSQWSNEVSCKFRDLTERNEFLEKKIRLIMDILYPLLHASTTSVDI